MSGNFYLTFSQGFEKIKIVSGIDDPKYQVQVNLFVTGIAKQLQ